MHLTLHLFTLNFTFHFITLCSYNSFSLVPWATVLQQQTAPWALVLFSRLFMRKLSSIDPAQEPRQFPAPWHCSVTANPLPFFQLHIHLHNDLHISYYGNVISLKASCEGPYCVLFGLLGWVNQISSGMWLWALWWCSAVVWLTPRTAASTLFQYNMSSHFPTNDWRLRSFRLVRETRKPEKKSLIPCWF